MTDARHKRAILDALRCQPDFEALTALPELASGQGANLLRWLDRSGLALPFLQELQKHGAMRQISEPWRLALESRQERNRARTADMLEEFRRIHERFEAGGVRAAAMKGFTLVPDFCDDATARHQMDFDFLIAPASLSAATEALQSRGYVVAHRSNNEACLATPLKHIPSAQDDIYAVQRQRQVDLHTSLVESSAWLPLEAPADCMEFAVPHRSDGLEYLGLSLADKFLLQVLHAFRHALRSWIRLSWLLEIGKCLARHENEKALWNLVEVRAGSAPLTQSAFALILGLVQRLFGTSIPAPLHSWSGGAASISVHAWLEHFAFGWATSDWPGSLSNVFLAKEFIPDPELRSQYWRSRLLPKKEQAALGLAAEKRAAGFLRWQSARLRYVAERGARHLKDVLALPWQGFRWKRALASARRLTFDASW